MSRPIKYKTADDLLNRCHIHNDCYVWPESSCPIPMLGPSSPMVKKFGTTSVVRILFVICRYIPLGKRLVRRCNSEFCVNPYHYTESRKYLEKRAKLPNREGLFPQQEEVRHLIAPPDSEIEAMRPIDPVHTKRLRDSAAVAGYDCSGLPDNGRYVPPRLRKATYAGIEPVLVMKNYEPPREIEPAKPISDEDWDELERPFRKQDSLPEVLDATEPEVERPELTNGIFEMIRRRKEWEEQKHKP